MDKKRTFARRFCLGFVSRLVHIATYEVRGTSVSRAASVTEAVAGATGRTARNGGGESGPHFVPAIRAEFRVLGSSRRAPRVGRKGVGAPGRKGSRPPRGARVAWTGGPLGRAWGAILAHERALGGRTHLGLRRTHDPSRGRAGPEAYEGASREGRSRACSRSARWVPPAGRASARQRGARSVARRGLGVERRPILRSKRVGPRVTRSSERAMRGSALVTSAPRGASALERSWVGRQRRPARETRSRQPASRARASVSCVAEVGRPSSGSEKRAIGSVTGRKPARSCGCA